MVTLLLRLGGMRERNADEIEITPEMIAAALPHLYRYHPDRGVGDETTITLIFQAMNQARRNPQP